MRRGHGDADALWGDGFDPRRFDRLVADGGAGDDAAAARAVLTNRLLGPGRFGKLFPDLEPFRPPDADLVALGLAMRESAPDDPRLNTSDVPAGFTYLGQFVDHDMTLDKTVGFPEVDDPEDLEQARTPNFDLDSLYGRGPAQQPTLYERGVPRARAAFRIGRTAPGESPGGRTAPPVRGGRPHDLPRASNGRALLGDARNDENLVIAQLHLQFLKFHNRVLRSLGSGRGEREPGRFALAEEARGPGVPFFRARRAVRWHYQVVVLEEFLPKLVDAAVLRDVREHGRRFFTFDAGPYGGRPFMPLEFSGAAYRLGHSMVRETYDFNRVFARPEVEPDALTAASLELLFRFTGGGGGAPIPGNWVADWTRLFDLGGDPARLNLARRLDAKLIPQLHELPGPSPSPEFASLAVRNLVRGSRIGLPAGQDVAEAMGVAALTPHEIAQGEPPAVRDGGFDRRSPLWYYVLREAELHTGGTRLGAVGSRIVAEVFVGLLEADPFSYLNQAEDGWAPGEPDPAGIALPVATPGTFTMADLLRYVNEVNPLG